MSGLRRPCRSVLVTGGQGFTGRHLVSRWLAHDDVRIVAVGRSPQLDDTFTHAVTWAGRSVPAPIPMAARVADTDRYTYMALDLSDDARLAKVLIEAEVDTVVHLAASLRDGPSSLGPQQHRAPTRCSMRRSQRAATICGSCSARRARSTGRSPRPPYRCRAARRPRSTSLGHQAHRRGPGLDLPAVPRARCGRRPAVQPHRPGRGRTPSGAEPGPPVRRADGGGDGRAGAGRSAGHDPRLRRRSRRGCRADRHQRERCGRRPGQRRLRHRDRHPVGVRDPLSAVGSPSRSIRRAPAASTSLGSAPTSPGCAMGFEPAHSLADSLEVMLRYYLDQVAAPPRPGPGGQR